MSFEPNIQTTLRIEGVVYHIVARTDRPGLPVVCEGRQATVYQLAPSAAEGGGNDGENNRLALKIFESFYRPPRLNRLPELLSPLAQLPGLAVAAQVVLDATNHWVVLRRHPELDQAIVMPWIDGPTWGEVLRERRPLTARQSRALAHGLARALAALESRGGAHCELSGANLLLPRLAAPAPAAGPAVALVDLEHLYTPSLKQPLSIPAPAPGYAHLRLGGSPWGPEGDRFAGAILLAEMLGWCEPRVQEWAFGPSYFDPKQLQQPGERYRVLAGSLGARWGQAVADLLERAWQSTSPADCPPFSEWLAHLPDVKPLRVATGPMQSLPVTPAEEAPLDRPGAAAPPAALPSDQSGDRPDDSPARAQFSAGRPRAWDDAAPRAPVPSPPASAFAPDASPWSRGHLPESRLTTAAGGETPASFE